MFPQKHDSQVKKKKHVTPIHKKITIAMDTLNITLEEHYMVNWRYKISLMVLKNISDLSLHGHVIPSLYIVYKFIITKQQSETLRVNAYFIGLVFSSNIQENIKGRDKNTLILQVFSSTL